MAILNRTTITLFDVNEKTWNSDKQDFTDEQLKQITELAVSFATYATIHMPYKGKKFNFNTANIVAMNVDSYVVEI